MIAKNAEALTKEQKEAAKAEKKRLKEEVQVTADGTIVEDKVLTEEDELTLAEARRIIADRKKEREDKGFDGPTARVFNGKTTYAVFTKAQYGESYKEIAQEWAHARQFSVEFI